MEHEDKLIKQLKEKFSKVLDFHYGKYKWDILIGGISRDRKYIDGHIIMDVGDFTITNSNERTHHITDMYVLLVVRCYFDSKHRLLDHRYSVRGFQGTRTARTIEEHSCGYVHSHLPSWIGEAPLFQTFCTGGGETDMSIMLSELYEESMFNMQQFELFLVYIDSFLRWESLEGTPHMYMSNIGVRGIRDEQTLWEGTFLKVREKVRESLLKLPVTWEIKGNCQTILVLDRDGPEFKHIMDNYGADRGSLDTMGKFIGRPTSSLLLREWKKLENEFRLGSYKHFKFNGVHTRYRVYRPKFDINNGISGKDVNPKEVSYVADQLQRRLDLYNKTNLEDIQKHGAGNNEIYLLERHLRRNRNGKVKKQEQTETRQEKAVQFRQEVQWTFNNSQTFSFRAGELHQARVFDSSQQDSSSTGSDVYFC